MPIGKAFASNRIALAALTLLSACGGAPDHASAQNSAQPRPAAAAPGPATACEPDAPQSPCPIVGHWRIAKVYNPAAANPLEDDRSMIGAKLTITANGDASGVLRWDGPDTGQFDISDVCTGPFLSPRGQPAGDARTRQTLKAALAAWSEGGNADAARSIGCDQGQWTVPSNASGQWYGIVLPLGRHVALQWYEGRFLLLERIS